MSKTELNPDQIAQVIKEVTSKGEGAPIEIVISPSEKFVAQTPQEMLEKLAQAKQHSNQHIERIESENREFKTKLAELESKIPKPPVDPNDSKAAEYYQTWAKDHTKANMQSLADGLGIPVERLKPLILSTLESNIARSGADEFLSRQPDFPETPQNAALIRQGLIQRFGTGPEAATADNLELVYHDLVRKGAIVPNTLQASGVVNGSTPLPNLRSVSAPVDEASSLTQKLMDMPIEEHKKALDRLLALQNGRR